MADTSLTDSLVDESGLDERERAFLDVLFDECKGDVPEAMAKVGYPTGTASAVVRKKLSKHIKERSKDFLVSSTAKAVTGMVSVLSNPAAVGNGHLIAASKEIMDRSGIFKEEAVQVTEIRNMFILPAKEAQAEDE
jgi:hypothetical protein